MLKQLIKDLAKEQKELKKSRKTGPYTLPMKEIDGYSYIDWKNAPDICKIIEASNGANSKVQWNKIRITAALNLYHEMRGSDYRHNVPVYKEYVYKREYEKLKALVNTPKLA